MGSLSSTFGLFFIVIIFILPLVFIAVIKEIRGCRERPSSSVCDITEFELCLIDNSGSRFHIDPLRRQKLLQLLEGWCKGNAVETKKSTYSPIHRSQPSLSGHVDLEHDVHIAFRVRLLVHWHAFTLGDDGLSRFDDFSWGAAHMNAPSVEMGHEDSRNPEKGFRECDL
jgi:hypothetical protein